MRRPRRVTAGLILGVGVSCLLGLCTGAAASTYAVYIPLDSSIYDELNTLDGLGYLDTYLQGVKPFSRVEAARLTLEAERNLEEATVPDRLAHALIGELRDQLSEEIGWIETNTEDQQPTMISPLNRLEAQYIYTSGGRRFWRTQPNQLISNENAPLLQNTDGLANAPGSNEVLRGSSWIGVGGFLTLYGEGAIAGPLNHAVDDGERRFQSLGAATVLSLGNLALSFGTEETNWGVGAFGALSQGANAEPFPAFRIQNIHPTYLPWIFRYLGPGRRVLFMGQLDADRQAQHPWIVGHIMAFKPLPTFEMGLTRAIIFGGRGNDHYNFSGFLGRFTGINTGSVTNGETNSRGGVYLKFVLPKLRGVQIYQEILGEDNLTSEIPGIGRFMPLLAVSYQGGFYLPRLTADGRTDLRFEYAILEPNYSTHDRGEYWVYRNQLMGDALGPNATQVDVQLGRWLDLHTKLSSDIFYTEQAPNYGANGQSYPAAFYPYPLGKEHSVGVAFDLLRLGDKLSALADSRVTIRARAAAEYVSDLNYQAGAHSMRLTLMLTTALEPHLGPWKWH